MGLYLLDYGAGNVQSLANSLKNLGHEFQWVTSPDDFHKATVSVFRIIIFILFTSVWWSADRLMCTDPDFPRCRSVPNRD
jgi:hypothetical protein